VTGDEVRDIWFLAPLGTKPIRGYDRSEVADLLCRVAAELDAGRPAGPLIESATFRRQGWEPACDIDAVDWFLEQFLSRPGQPEPAAISADPWQDRGVTQFTRGGGRDLASLSPRALWDSFVQECANAWCDFGQLPGTQLGWGRAGDGHTELNMAGHTLASCRYRSTTVSASGRTFTWQTSRANSSLPGIADIFKRSQKDYRGHFAKPGRITQIAQLPGLARARALVDEAGNPILYTTGAHYNGRACARVWFPDGRWLRFLVRGTSKDNAIMTAVDQAGNNVAKYKKFEPATPTWDPAGITVHPAQTLTDELVIAIAISAPWLAEYIEFPAEGGDLGL
jgi:hypothetical protein